MTITWCHDDWQCTMIETWWLADQVLPTTWPMTQSIRGSCGRAETLWTPWLMVRFTAGGHNTLVHTQVNKMVDGEHWKWTFGEILSILPSFTIWSYKLQKLRKNNKKCLFREIDKMNIQYDLTKLLTSSIWKEHEVAFLDVFEVISQNWTRHCQIYRGRCGDYLDVLIWRFGLVDVVKFTEKCGFCALWHVTMYPWWTIYSSIVQY